jgi:hypothetical protein
MVKVAFCLNADEVARSLDGEFSSGTRQVRHHNRTWVERMNDSPLNVVSPPTSRHLFKMSPKVRPEVNDRLVLVRSMPNRMILYAELVLGLAGLTLYVWMGLDTRKWISVSQVYMLVIFLSSISLLWTGSLIGSVASVTFDRGQALMRTRPHLYPLQRGHDRSLKELLAIQIVTFNPLKVVHIRLIFGESDKLTAETVELAGYWRMSDAIGLARQLSKFLGVPLIEATYPPRGK